MQPWKAVCAGVACHKSHLRRTNSRAPHTNATPASSPLMQLQRNCSSAPSPANVLVAVLHSCMARAPAETGRVTQPPRKGRVGQQRRQTVCVCALCGA
jgi:hypothetical protein